MSGAVAAVYSPWWAGTCMMVDSDTSCGMSIMATVMPATMSNLRSRCTL